MTETRYMRIICQLYMIFLMKIVPVSQLGIGEQYY